MSRSSIAMRISCFLSVVTALATLFVSFPQSGAAQGRGGGGRTEVFGEHSRGARAMSLLKSSGLGLEVAQRHGMSEAKLNRLLERDNSLWMDETASLFYIDSPLEGTTAAGPAQLSPGCPGRLPTEAFSLHSKAGAAKTIYLDFNGQNLSGTVWNTASYTLGTNFTAPAWDTDGNPSIFSDAERAGIVEIWCRVAEDYAAFDVDVTTELPTEAVLTRSSSTDTQYGTRALISPIGSYVCSGCGGIAYINIFGAVGDYYKPALIFPERLSNVPRYIAEAISHEVGHNLGLNHDGTSSASYYSGQGSGDTSWAPIMGVGYYTNVTQWSKGEYTGANNTEDDLAIINTSIPYRADDHGNTIATATDFPIVGGFATKLGLVNSRTDIDYFKLSVASGTVTIDVRPEALGPNLDIQISLRDAANNLLATINPVARLDATITSFPVTAGTYYLTVEGVGVGDPLVTGYSDYASMGQYDVSVTFTTTSGQAPPAALAQVQPSTGIAPLSVAFTGSGSVDSDGTIVRYDWDFGDNSFAAVADTSHVYTTPGSYSATLTVTDNSGLQGSMTVPITVAAANQAPTASFTASPASGTAPLVVAFNGSASTDPDGTISSYAWQFGDGGTGSGATSSHTYSAAGNYTATLTVTDNKGATASTSKQISVSAPNQPPTANFSASPSTGIAPLAVAFNASASTDSDGTISSYAWQFGDGGTGSGVTISHSYVAAGTYTAKVTVTDNKGATASSSKQIVVTAANQPPTSSFSATPQNGTAPLVVAFNGSASTDSDGTISSYAWQFGDGGTGSGATISHTYVTAGTYTATLTVTDNSGAVSSSSKQVVVSAPVVSQTFSVSAITMTQVRVNNRKAVKATITIKDNSGALISGATVTGTWSMLVSGTSSGTTASNGQTTVTSPTTRSSGDVKFTITGVTKSGYTYNPASNTTSSATLFVQ